MARNKSNRMKTFEERIEENRQKLLAEQAAMLAAGDTEKAEYIGWDIEQIEQIQSIYAASKVVPGQPILNFDEPKKVHIEAGFEDGPTGGYVPQMSQEDAHRWKAKKYNIGKENARIELRKSFGGGISGRGPSSQLHMIVALDGWDYGKKHEYCREKGPNDDYFHFDTRGLNVRMSMNGPLLMTFETFAEINQIVNEARDYLLAN